MDYIEQNKKSYQQIYEENWGNRYPDSDLISIFYNLVKPCMTPKDKYRILDFGCSLGANTKFFQTIGFDVFGIDISEKAIEKCIEINGFDSKNFMCLDILKETKKIKDIFNCEFDIILASNVLYYFNNIDLVRVVEKFKESLSANGILMADMVSYNHNTYRMFGNMENDEGLIKVGKSGSVDRTLYVNIIKSREDVISLFQSFECIQVVRKLIEMNGENELFYYIGRKKQE